jgi:hypothetical protein
MKKILRFRRYGALGLDDLDRCCRRHRNLYRHVHWDFEDCGKAEKSTIHPTGLRKEYGNRPALQKPFQTRDLETALAEASAGSNMVASDDKIN